MKPKLHWYISEHKLYGYWKRNEASNGKPVRLRITREQAAWINTGCRADFRWVIDEPVGAKSNT